MRYFICVDYVSSRLCGNWAFLEILTNLEDIGNSLCIEEILPKDVFPLFALLRYYSVYTNTNSHKQTL